MVIHRNRMFSLCFSLLILTFVYTSTVFAGALLDELSSKGSVFIRFQPASKESPAGVLVNDGSVYSSERGYGWDQDLKPQARWRDTESSGICMLDRGISMASFTVDLPDGNYLFEVASLDNEFPGALTPMIDGTVIATVACPTGERVTIPVAVTSKVGKASVTFVGGISGYANSLISSIKITPESANPKAWESAKNAAEAVIKASLERKAGNEAKRSTQRASYKPAKLADNNSARQEFDLAGKWLFMPAQNITEAASAIDPSVDDKSWHTLPVPCFWNPIEWWIYSARSGTSHNYLRKEIERCENYSFDYKTTDAGWYRQWVDVPVSMKGKRLVLKFDAVASICEVYWNGKRVGSHAGMFGPFECEVTSNVKFGNPNLLSVFVAAGKVDQQTAKQVSITAVTVSVTGEMLNSLPHGWFRIGLAGIWQPVKLEVTGRDRITDVFFKPGLNGAVIESAVDLKSKQKLQVRHIISEIGTGRKLYQDSKGLHVPDNGKLTASIKGLKPKLWSPEHPNLYKLTTQLYANGKLVDQRADTVGFRTFEARGNRLYLNGKPYFMRGSNMPPHGLAPNDAALADKFIKLMHDGNEMVTRFHVCPPPKMWMDACDKHGVGVSSDGTWPWVLMGSTPIPDKKMLEIWKDDFFEIVKANRNHPSFLFWTVSNESYFENDSDETRRLEKFRIFSDVIKGIRKLDPTKPVVFHSGHIRNAKYYDSVLKPNGLDDGDIDDGHYYYGWYQQSPFHFDFKKIEGDRGAGNRPLISQEASTGYPDNDTGHPVESYIRDYIVPQAWVGKYALYSTRPDMFLEKHGQITKEYAEKVRRERTYLSGWGLFATTCWFKDVYDAERIMPYPVYWGVQKAYQPVLVSIDSADRHFEGGQKFRSNVFVVNDDPDRPKATNLSVKWRIFGKNQEPGTTGTVQIADCLYDGKSKAECEFVVPLRLPVERSVMTLAFDLYSGDELISRNDYPLICATNDYCTTANGQQLIVLENGSGTSDYLKSVRCVCESQKSIDWTKADTGTCVVIAPEIIKSAIGSGDNFQAFLKRGGRVLMLSSGCAGTIEGTPDESKCELIPGIPVNQLKTVKVEGDFADVLAPELLSAMDPMDMQWWSSQGGDVVRVCRTSYQLPDAPGITKLVQHINPHAYIKREQIPGLTSWPVFEVKCDQGRVVVSSMALAQDPLAKRFTLNLLNYLARK